MPTDPYVTQSCRPMTWSWLIPQRSSKNAARTKERKTQRGAGLAWSVGRAAFREHRKDQAPQPRQPIQRLLYELDHEFADSTPHAAQKTEQDQRKTRRTSETPP